MFFNHPHTEIKNQILAVATYAAVGDCLTEVNNNASEEQEPAIMAMVDELKKKTRTLYACDFIRYANALASKLGMQSNMIERRNNYLRLSSDLMEPTPERYIELDTKYKDCTQFHNRAVYLLRCFVDCGAEQCLKKILVSVPERIKNSMIGYVFPESFVSLLDIPDDRMVTFMLDAGMNPDSHVSLSNFFGDTFNFTLLEFALKKLSRMIDEADARTHCIDEQQLQTIRNMIAALIARNANADMDAHYPGDPGTPRGLAYTLLEKLDRKENIPLMQEIKMREVLNLVKDMPRDEELKFRPFCFA